MGGPFIFIFSLFFFKLLVFSVVSWIVQGSAPNFEGCLVHYPRLSLTAAPFKGSCCMYGGTRIHPASYYYKKVVGLSRVSVFWNKVSGRHTYCSNNDWTVCESGAGLSDQDI